MNPLLQIAAAFLGSVGFARLFNLHGRWILYTACGGCLSWTVYLFTGLFTVYYGLQYFVAAFFLEIYAEIMAIRTKAPSTIYLAVGMIPLIPGAALYRTMQYAVIKNLASSANFRLESLVTAAAIAAGVIAATVCWNMIKINLLKK